MLTMSQDNLELVQTLVNGGIALRRQLNARSAFLACSGDAYGSTSDAHFIDPTLDEGTTAGRQCELEYRPPALTCVLLTRDADKSQRIFYAKNSPTDSKGRKTAVLRPAPNQGSICGNAEQDMMVNAETFPSSRNPTNQPSTQLVLCDLPFNGEPDSTGAAFQTTINPDPGPPAQNAPKRLWKFTTGVLIHEMFHTLGAKSCRLAVELPHAPNADSLTDVDRVFNDNTGPFESYGLQNIYSIAQKTGVTAQSEDLTTTDLPDAYRMFCEECHFSGTSWNISGAGG